jgi:hypothetical protein
MTLEEGLAGLEVVEQSVSQDGLCGGSDDDKRHSHSSKLGQAIHPRPVGGGESEMCLYAVTGR